MGWKKRIKHWKILQPTIMEKSKVWWKRDLKLTNLQLTKVWLPPVLQIKENASSQWCYIGTNVPRSTRLNYDIWIIWHVQNRHWNKSVSWSKYIFENKWFWLRIYSWLVPCAHLCSVVAVAVMLYVIKRHECVCPTHPV